MIAPLFIENEWQGAVRFDRMGSNAVPWDQTEVDAARMAGEYLAALLESVQQRRFAQMNLQLAQRLMNVKTLDDLAANVEQATLDMFQWDAFFISVRPPGTDTFWRIEAVDTIRGERIRLGHKRETLEAYLPHLEQVIHNEALLINRNPDSPADEGLTRFGDSMRPSASLMFAPVAWNSAVAGVISIQSYQPFRYTQSDLNRLKHTASIVGSSLRSLLAEMSLSDHGRMYQHVLEMAVAPILVFDADVGIVLETNQTAERILGASVGQVRGRPIQDFLPGSERSRFDQFLNSLHESRRHSLINLTLTALDGRELVMKLSALLINQHGRSVVQCVFHDKTSLLRDDEEGRVLLASFPELSPNPVVELTVDGEPIYLNPEAERMFPELRKTGPEHPFIFNLTLEADRHREHGRTYFTREVEIGDKWFEQMVHLTLPNRLRVFAFDITARKKAEAQLRFEALHDPLTRLPNRLLFLDRLNKSLMKCGRDPETHLAVFFMDLDNFKVINDSLGHHMGDQLLREFTQRVQQCLRPGDTLARLGGDEFTVLLESITGREAACQVAKRILRAAGEPFVLGDQELHITTSIGLVYRDEASVSAEDILRDADTAMYHAKRMGKNQFVVFEEGLHAAVMQRRLLTTDFRRALNEEFFTLHYQPVVALNHSGRRVMGMEALARWFHPERGLVPPAELISLADESGMGEPFAHWTLEEACQQIRVWEARYKTPLCVFANLSGRQIHHPELAPHLKNVLTRVALAPDRLILDIPEHHLMSEPQSVVEQLWRLKKIGVRVCIEDFGAGSSSLNYLALYPIDFIKINRSFVHRLISDAHCRRVAETAAAMSRTLGCGLIAVGVEHDSTLPILQDIGCELAQGFLFGEPMDSADADSFLTSELTQ
ncbi:MAG: hypothetical protein Kow0059_07010 [Candidatus Sumerlaeia bacterium]